MQMSSAVRTTEHLSRNWDTHRAIAATTLWGEGERETPEPIFYGRDRFRVSAIVEGVPWPHICIGLWTSRRIAYVSKTIQLRLEKESRHRQQLL